jgi:alpha-glucosidase
MKLYRFRSECDYDIEVLQAGDHYVKADLCEVLLFVRPDKLVILSRGAKSVSQINTNQLYLMDYSENGAKYDWYDDDGVSKTYALPQNWHTVCLDEKGTVSIGNYEGMVNRI